MPNARPIHEIARDIRKNWPKVNYAAAPYLDAMRCLDEITDQYIRDEARDIIGRFLCNASTFRGADAQRIKAELRAIIK